jgi:release factor glutamine methyltransferase
MQDISLMTAIEALNYSAELFRQKGIEDARLNAELILCNVLKYDRVKLYLNFDKPLNHEERELIMRFSERRISREPVQHILGKTSFFGYDIVVNDKVLIPRPETEFLTEKILEDIKESGKDKVSVFEIGTGSGCIPVALAKSLEKDDKEIELFSIDNSQEAVNTAKENLVLNGLSGSNIRFVVKDVFEIERLTRQFDYLVSNPPYVSSEEYLKLEPEVREFEPGAAITDFGNGLRFFERIFMVTSDSEFKGKVFCEIGFGQKESIVKLLEQFKLNNFTFYNDHSDIPRVLKIEK